MRQESLTQTVLVIVGSFLFLLPFQVWNSVAFPAQTSKILFGIWITPIFLFLLILSLLREKTFNIYLTRVDIGFFGFLLYILIHSFILKPVNKHPFFLPELTCLSSLYLILRIYCIKYWDILIYILLSSVLGQCIWGLLQYYGLFASYHSEFPITGTFFNPAPYAGYLVAILPLSIGMLFLSKKGYLSQQIFNNSSNKFEKLEFPLKCLVVISLLMLYLVKSRASWIAGFFSILFLIPALYKFAKLGFLNIVIDLLQSITLKYKIIILSTSVLISVLGMTVGIYQLYHLRTESADGRLLVWKAASDMVIDKPVFGHGVGQFKAQYMHYQAKYLLETPKHIDKFISDNTIFAFNDLLLATIELGFIGFIILTLLLATAFYQPKKEISSPLVILARSGLLALFVFGQFSYPASVFPLMILAIFFMAAISHSQSTLPIKFLSLGKRTFRIILIVILSAFIVISSIQVYRLTNAYHQCKITAEGNSQQSSEKMMEIFEGIYPVLKNDGFFTIMYGSCLLINKQYLKAGQILQQATRLLPVSEVYLSLGEYYLASGKINEAEGAFQYALQMVPNRAKPVLALAKLYLQTGRIQESKCQIEEYLNSSIKKNSVASYQIELELTELYKQMKLGM